MAKPQLHSALWLGKSYTLSVSAWSRKTGRSTSFFWRALQIAEDKGIEPDKRMQYALDEMKPGRDEKRSKLCQKEIMVAPRFSEFRENIARAENKNTINSFLLGVGKQK